MPIEPRGAVAVPGKERGSLGKRGGLYFQGFAGIKWEGSAESKPVADIKKAERERAGERRRRLGGWSKGEKERNGDREEHESRRRSARNFRRTCGSPGLEATFARGKFRTRWFLAGIRRRTEWLEVLRGLGPVRSR